MSMLATAAMQNAKRAQKEQQRELINIYERSRARMLNKISPTVVKKGEEGLFLTPKYKLGIRKVISQAESFHPSPGPLPHLLLDLYREPPPLLPTSPL